ncbi:MAG: lipoyl protein ligase domain-containing protein [Acidimicrobiales bacterium]
MPEAPARAVSVLTVDRPALVIGSTQPEGLVDRAAAEAAGVEVVRRRSGGGAVLLVPGEVLWVDVVIPRVDRLWDDDVVRASRWLGRAWAGAVGELGIRAEVGTEAPTTSPWARRVCFAGVSPGEVTVDGRKLVGVAQRRSRRGARFQCAVLRRWDPAPLLDLLALGDEERAEAGAGLAGVATGLDRPWPLVVDALVDHLPA